MGSWQLAVGCEESWGNRFDMTYRTNRGYRSGRFLDDSSE